MPPSYWMGLSHTSKSFVFKPETNTTCGLDIRWHKYPQTNHWMAPIAVRCHLSWLYRCFSPWLEACFASTKLHMANQASTQPLRLCSNGAPRSALCSNTCGIRIIAIGQVNESIEELGDICNQCTINHINRITPYWTIEVVFWAKTKPVNRSHRLPLPIEKKQLADASRMPASPWPST